MKFNGNVKLYGKLKSQSRYSRYAGKTEPPIIRERSGEGFGRLPDSFKRLDGQGNKGDARQVRSNSNGRINTFYKNAEKNYDKKTR